MSLTSVLKKTYPWFLWIGLYFYVVGPGFPEKTWKSVILKIMPIISLIFPIAATTSLNELHKWEKLKIVLGLLFSVVGDVFMIWMEDNQMMMFGGIAFSVAHLFYISAFSFRHYGGLMNAAFSYGIFAIATYFIFPHVPKQSDRFFVPGYLFLLCTMFWRAAARFLEQPNFGSLCACVGGYVFIVSDIVILVHKFIIDVKHANLWIMLTYYIAQLGIALSVVFFQEHITSKTKVEAVRKKRYAKRMKKAVKEH